MNVSDASKLCAEHGATLINYQHPRMALIGLRSGEHVLISIGTTSAKIFRRSRWFGWVIPKCCASKPLTEWEPRYTQCNNLHRTICRGMVLDGLLNLVPRANSIDELCIAWCAIKNSREIASVKLFTKTFPDTNWLPTPKSFAKRQRNAIGGQTLVRVCVSPPR